MDTTLVADIGSTFTKVTLFDAAGVVVWRGQAPTRTAGLGETERLLRQAAGASGFEWPQGRVAACSSAAGGLRLVVLGLTRTFTYEAALHTALGAGARVVGRFASALTDADLQDLQRAGTDVVLLTGGTDGGDGAAALAFASRLATVPRSLSVVVACNRAVADACRARLERSGHAVVVTPNVMPEVGRYEFEPARAAIRDIFLHQVISRLTDRGRHGFDVRMPTPAAVLQATVLLSRVSNRSLVVVDVGGATTDVHSVLLESPPAAHGLTIREAERVLRTVEADLGVRESALSLISAVEERGATFTTHPLPGDALRQRARELSVHVDALAAPDDPVDSWLAGQAARIALERHVGEWTARTSPDGVKLVPAGRDLRSVDVAIGTGGVLSRDRSDVLERALVLADGNKLVPEAAVVASDHEYALPSLGVLAHLDPQLGQRAAEHILGRMVQLARR